MAMDMSELDDPGTSEDMYNVLSEVILSFISFYLPIFISCREHNAFGTILKSM